jgi:TonB family protein
MKRRQLLTLVATLAMTGSLHAFAGEIKVIANTSVKTDTISVREIERVFLEQNSSLSDGTHVEPVIEKDGAVHEAFLQQYLGRTNDDLQSYYRALVFTGRGSMPRELGSDAEVVAYVSKNRGAIGYVSAGTNSAGAKTLAIVNGADGSERRLLTHIDPEYPETLKRLNIGGIVRLQVTIAPKGNVEKVELLGGNPILGESAITAVKQWIYGPNRARTTAEVSIPFEPSR